MAKLKFIGAVSVAAFMAAGLSACGGEKADEVNRDIDEAAAEAEAAVDEAVEGAADAAEAGADAVEDGMEAAGETIDDVEDAVEDAVDSADDDETDDPRAMLDTGGEAAGTLASLSTMSLADVRRKDDIALVTEASFLQADGDGDGVLSLAEFAEMTGLGVKEGAGLSNAAGKVDNALGDAAGLVENAIVDQTFALAAGVDGEMTKDELREVFLARFEEADTNENGELEDDERIMFATPTKPEKIENQ